MRKLEDMIALANARARRKPREEEHRLQCACVRWFRMQYPALSELLFAVPNGGRRDRVTGAKLKAEGVVAGVSDLILLSRCCGYGALLIEMKCGKGRQSDAQRAWQSLVERNGYRYAVCRTFEEFTETIKTYLNDKGTETQGQAFGCPHRQA